MSNLTEYRTKRFCCAGPVLSCAETDICQHGSTGEHRTINSPVLDAFRCYQAISEPNSTGAQENLYLYVMSIEKKYPKCPKNNLKNLYTCRAPRDLLCSRAGSQSRQVAHA